LFSQIVLVHVISSYRTDSRFVSLDSLYKDCIWHGLHISKLYF